MKNVIIIILVILVIAGMGVWSLIKQAEVIKAGPGIQTPTPAPTPTSGTIKLTAYPLEAELGSQSIMGGN